MELSLLTIKTRLSNFFGRYHYIIFFVFIVSGLAIAMLVLNQTVASSDEPNGYSSDANKITLDQTTIDKLRKLKKSDETTPKLEITGRSNPF